MYMYVCFCHSPVQVPCRFLFDAEEHVRSIATVINWPTGESFSSRTRRESQHDALLTTSDQSTFEHAYT